MAVRADQRAILELLLNHGIDYETIGAVLSTGSDGARARARAALSSLAGETQVDDSLADFLLGRAVASERTRTVQTLAEDAEANALARRLANALSVEFEGATLPHIPSLHDDAVTNGGGASYADEAPARSRWSTVLRVLLAVLIAAVVALAVTLAFPSEDTDEPAAPAEPSLTEIKDVIPLRAPGGGDARGEAVIGFNSEAEAYLELDVDGLTPVRGGEVQLLWIDVADDAGLPMPPPVPTADDGSYHHRLGLPIELIAALDQAESLAVISVGADELPDLRREFDTNAGKDLVAAVDQLPDRPGLTVLEGEIPTLASASATN